MPHAIYFLQIHYLPVCPDINLLFIACEQDNLWKTLGCAADISRDWMHSQSLVYMGYNNIYLIRSNYLTVGWTGIGSVPAMKCLYFLTSRPAIKQVDCTMSWAYMETLGSLSQITFLYFTPKHITYCWHLTCTCTVQFSFTRFGKDLVLNYVYKAHLGIFNFISQIIPLHCRVKIILVCFKLITCAKC